MFEFFFKYPSPVFTKGRFVLLSSWPAWLLPVLIVASAGGLALLVRWRLRDVAPKLQTWRAWAVWAMQSCFVALILLLLWQPAINVAALSSRQNIIAVLVDDSRSMGIADLYPFVLAPTVIAKLTFVHDRIRAQADRRPASNGALRAMIAGLRQRVGSPGPT